MSRLQLTVTGMNCAGCEWRIAAALGRLDGVRHVDADHSTGTVVVDYDPAELEESTIRWRLTESGYAVGEVQAQ